MQESESCVVARFWCSYPRQTPPPLSLSLLPLLCPPIAHTRAIASSLTPHPQGVSHSKDTQHASSKQTTNLRGVVVVAFVVAVAAAHGRGHLRVHEHVRHHPRHGVRVAAHVLRVVRRLVCRLKLVQIEHAITSAGIELCVSCSGGALLNDEIRRPLHTRPSFVGRPGKHGTSAEENKRVVFPTLIDISMDIFFCVVLCCVGTRTEKVFLKFLSTEVGGEC